LSQELVLSLAKAWQSMMDRPMKTGRQDRAPPPNVHQPLAGGDLDAAIVQHDAGFAPP
jgi:hypothetical protein